MRTAQALLALCCLALAAHSSAYGQGTPPLTAQAGNAPSDAQAEFTELFAAFCLMKFPDFAAADFYAHAKGMKPMPQDRLRRILGKDPGTGWLYDSGYGTYAVTIENPPYHTCAIRKRFAKVPDIKTGFGTLLKLWAATQHVGTVTELPPKEMEIDGHKSKAYLWELARAGSTDKENFLALVTPVPGQDPEIRLARMLGNR
jgi:hypothetical protein